MLNIEEIFEKNENEFLKFEDVTEKLNRRPDVCAFLIIDKILGDVGERDIVCAAEHDEIWLDVDVEILAQKAKEEDILNLMRCGVRYDRGVGSLAMFV